MKNGLFFASGIFILLTSCAMTPTIPISSDKAALTQQVIATERQFAKTMADRDHAAFLTFVSDEAIFLNGGKPLHGKVNIGEYWKKFYLKPAAPFSWEPEFVEVLNSGTLAQSSGPVRDPEGKIFARFTSTWRHESPGVWKIVFDDGYAVCNCANP